MRAPPLMHDPATTHNSSYTIHIPVIEKVERLIGRMIHAVISGCRRGTLKRRRGERGEGRGGAGWKWETQPQPKASRWNQVLLEEKQEKKMGQSVSALPGND